MAAAVARVDKAVRSVAVRPGWRAALIGLILAAAAAILIDRWATTGGRLGGFGAVAGIVALAIGLAAGSNLMVAVSGLPALGAATIALDRPIGHAWGQTLLTGLLWYLASESSWESIEARRDVACHPAVARQRVREMATVVAVTAVVTAIGVGLSTVAPPRTAVVRALAVVLVLVTLTVVQRVVRRPPEPPPPSP